MLARESDKEMGFEVQSYLDPHGLWGYAVYVSGRLVACCCPYFKSADDAVADGFVLFGSLGRKSSFEETLEALVA